MLNFKGETSPLQNNTFLSGIRSFFGLLQVAEMNVKSKSPEPRTLLARFGE